MTERKEHIVTVLILICKHSELFLLH